MELASIYILAADKKAVFLCGGGGEREADDKGEVI